MGGKKAESGKNRKYGRNKTWCEMYRLRGQREKNKKRRLMTIFRRLKKKFGDVPDKELIKHLEKLGVNVTSL